MLVVYGLFISGIIQVLQAFLRLTLPINNSYIILQVVSQLFQMGGIITGVFTILGGVMALLEKRHNRFNDDFELGTYYTVMLITGVCINIVSIL